MFELSENFCGSLPGLFETGNEVATPMVYIITYDLFIYTSLNRQFPFVKRSSLMDLAISGRNRWIMTRNFPPSSE